MVVPALLLGAYLLVLAVALPTRPLAPEVRRGLSRVFGVMPGEVPLRYPIAPAHLRLMGLAIGVVLGGTMTVLMRLSRLPAWLGLLVAPLGYLSVTVRYEGGWPKSRLRAMERELPSLTAFVLELAGIGNLPVPLALLSYADHYPDRPLAALIRRTPPGGDPIAFLQELGIASAPVNGVLAVFAEAQRSPRRLEALLSLQDDQEQRVRLSLERVIEGRVAKAPIVMVVILFPALMVTAMVPVVTRFLSLMGAMR